MLDLAHRRLERVEDQHHGPMPRLVVAGRLQQCEVGKAA